jgi:hypothetical protein
VEIEQYLWGASPSGEGILLYKLRSADGREVYLTNAGAAVVGITFPDVEQPLAVRFTSPEALLADYTDRGKTLCGNYYGFGQRIWESRVESNRVVMELPEGEQGEPAMAVMFDWDDEGELVVTHLSRGVTTQPFAMNTQLFWQGAWRITLQVESTDSPTEERSYPVKGWATNILGHAATLCRDTDGITIEVYSSQPAVRISRIGECVAVLCEDSAPAPLDASRLYCHKTLYRMTRRK